MGIKENPTCTRYSREHGDLIHLLWRCLKLHRYWRKVLDSLNRVFQVILADRKPCVLGILDHLLVEDVTNKAIARALFQARKLILRRWKSTDPPSTKEWIGVALHVKEVSVVKSSNHGNYLVGFGLDFKLNTSTPKNAVFYIGFIS